MDMMRYKYFYDTINGYAFICDLEKSCKYGIRFKFIMNGEMPSHMAFER